LFDKAGVAYPNNDWTWNNFLEAAKKLTLDKDKSGKVNQWGFGVLNIVWNWAGFVWGNGGEVLSPDRKKSHFQDPKTIEALKFYYGLHSEHKASPPPGALPEQASSLDWFRTQSVAMGLFGPWWRPTLVTLPEDKKFKWDVAYPPKAPGTGKRGSVVYTDHWSVGSGSKVAKDAWSFMRFLTGKDGQVMWTELIGARSISPVKEVAQTEKWLRYGGSTGEIILDSLSFSQAPPVNFANANEAETIWNDELGLVIAGQSKVEQAVQNIDTKLAPVLAANK
jgi:multiple sugar transport system substrate-binding protein